MRAVWLVVGVLVLASVASAASEKDSKPRKKTAAIQATAPALDRRVAESPTIFIGEGMRIYFVDRQYRETPYIRANGEGANKSALVAVKVVKALHPENASVPEKILVPIEISRNGFGVGRSPYDEEVERLVGKQNIWFGDVVVRKDYGDDKSGRKPLEAPVTLLVPAVRDPKRAATANAMPIARLKEVTDSIERMRGKAEGGRRKFQQPRRRKRADSAARETILPFTPLT